MRDRWEAVNVVNRTVLRVKINKEETTERRDTYFFSVLEFNSFGFQERYFLLDVGRIVSAVSADTAVGTYDPVARHLYRTGVLFQDLADPPVCFRLP